LREALVRRHPAVGEPTCVAVDVDQRADYFSLCEGSGDSV
jgi:hypothetical protein